MDQGTYVPPPMEPGTPERPSLGTTLASGWVRAIGQAALIFVVLAVIAEIVVFLLYIAAEEPRPSATVFAKAGGGIFYSFNHTGMVFEVPRATIPPGLIPGTAGQQVPGSLAVRFTAVLPILLGTVLLIWLLLRAGRDLGRDAGQAAPLWVRAVNGAKVAIPYALLCFGAAWLVRFSIPTPPGQVTIHPSYIAAFLWPLGLGLLFGALGGLRSGGDDQWASNVWLQRARGVLAGAGWMITLGLALSFGGLLVHAVVTPSATVDYFQGIFDQGVLSGISGIVATLMVVPNMAAFILFPAMIPGCLTATAQVVGPSFNFCVLSWNQFPGDVDGAGGVVPTGALPNPPIAYYLFVLAPLIAVILGGIIAVRRGKAQTRQEAIGVGAAAGFLFWLGALLVIILSAFSGHGSVTASQAAQTQSFNASLRFGPDLFPGWFPWALAWGVVGGAIGGLIEGRSRPARAVPAGPAWEPTAPAPPVPPG